MPDVKSSQTAEINGQSSDRHFVKKLVTSELEKSQMIEENKTKAFIFRN